MSGEADDAGYAKGRARRARIVRTAFEAFSAHGYRGASLVQIAADSGVSRAGLVHHFPTKESLLEAVLEERDRVDREQFFSGVTAPVDGLDLLGRFARLVEHNTSNRGIVGLFAVLSVEASDPSHPAHAYIATRYENLRRYLGAAIADLDARGLLRPGVEVEGLAAELIATVDGLQVQWLVAPDSVDMAAQFRRRLADLVTVGVG
ncbi:TetR/AcrR family transcriptional regulator [Microbacterium sp. NPDC058389]|uniref:TetR/AcrR family transcriptional regulator n=1 Tax=Microbacterium sp. NPDC058389 TaxID=3346475 RepID=UPI003653ACCB